MRLPPMALPAICSLDLDENSVTDCGLAALACHRLASQLTALDCLDIHAATSGTFLLSTHARACARALVHAPLCMHQLIRMRAESLDRLVLALSKVRRLRLGVSRDSPWLAVSQQLGGGGIERGSREINLSLVSLQGSTSSLAMPTTPADRWNWMGETATEGQGTALAAESEVVNAHIRGVNGCLSVCVCVCGGVRLQNRSRMPVCIYTDRSCGFDLCGSQGMYMASQSSRELRFHRRGGRQSIAGEREARARRRIRSSLHCEGTSISPYAVSL